MSAYRGSLSVYGNSSGPVEFTVAETKLEVKIGDGNDSYMGAKETNVYLSLISESILSGDFSPALYPTKTEVANHSLYKLGPLPLYRVGLRCCNQHNVHSEDCWIYVPAQEIEVWRKDNHLEHEALKEVCPQAWSWVCARLKD